MNKQKSKENELENEVFLPAPTRSRSRLFSSTAKFFRRKSSTTYKINDTNNSSLVKNLLEPDLQPKNRQIETKLNLKQKDRLREEIEGPVFAPHISKPKKKIRRTNLDDIIAKKAKSYPPDSSSEKMIPLSLIQSRKSIGEDKINSKEEINIVRQLIKPESLTFKGYYNLKYLSNLIADNAEILRDLNLDEVVELQTLHKSKSFDKIYYLPSTETNFKDTSDSDGHITLSNNDHIFYRFKIIDCLGRGSYGTVLKCKDNKYNIECALKIIKSTHKYRNCMFHELDILNRLHDNYIKCKNKGIDTSFFTQHLKTFEWRSHGIIVFKLYGKDLYHARLGTLSSNKLRQIMVDLFAGLIFLKDSNIVHCDLKPENILLTNYETCQIVLADFGLSKIISNITKLTDFNVQTCWYRSPEIVMHIPYSYEIDLWSVGVILIELIVKYPLFRAKSDKELFYLMLNILGDNPESMIPVNPEVRNCTIMGYCRQKLDDHIKKLVELMKKYEFIGVGELIDGILVWEPNKRLPLKKCYELAKKIN
jgi:hypothetical protein